MTGSDVTKCRHTGVLVLAAAIAMPMVAAAGQLLSEAEALKRAFPETTAVTAQWTALSSNQMARLGNRLERTDVPTVLQYYTASTNGGVVGHAMVHAVAGKYGPIRLLVATTPRLAVIRAEVLAFQERRGRPVRDQSFLSQFVGKTRADEFELRSDIDGVTGATVSSRAVTRGVREALAFLGVLTGQGKDDPSRGTLYK